MKRRCSTTAEKAWARATGFPAYPVQVFESNGGGGGNRIRVPVNRIKHLQANQVPQRCLTDFRLAARALQPIGGARLTRTHETQG